jgi:hypothetical protein
MAIEVKYTCPFGHTCEKTVDGHIERCVLYLELKSKNNITDKEESVHNCSLNWGVILQNETNSRIVGVQQATESFRNEMVQKQPLILNSILHGLSQS